MLIQIGGISVVYQCRSAVKFDGITSSISVDISGIPVVLPVVSIGISVVYFSITIVLPLESTVLPVVIPPNFTADFHWYTTGNTTGIQLVISEKFLWGCACHIV